MQTYITQTWQFKTHSIQGRCKCVECGKPITKTFSFETREDVPTQREDWDKLEERKQEWLKKPHICNSCKRKKITYDKNDVTSSYTFKFSKLDELQRQIDDIIKDKVRRTDCLKELEGKILVDKDSQEWVIERIREGSVNNIGFEITCYRINKRKPWLLTEDCKYFTNDKTMWNNFSTLEGCIITNEVFEKRAESLKN